jgi:hypothetical protein
MAVRRKTPQSSRKRSPIGALSARNVRHIRVLEQQNRSAREMIETARGMIQRATKMREVSICPKHLR